MRKLITKLRRREAAETVWPPPDTGAGVTYAVGDVHGRPDLLARLMDRIRTDAAGFPAPARVVFMGDYIDRGDGTRETVEMLRGLAGDAALAPVFLMGNHERMLLDFLGEPAAGDRWLRYGGLQTLLSYGVGGVAGLRAGEEAERLRDDLVAALGADLDFLAALAPSHRAGNVFFAHAGADPELPLAAQPPEALLWGSERFLRAERADGVWVVYGHFVVERAEAARGRIPVDTGAYFSGRLTAARLAGGEVAFLES